MKSRQIDPETWQAFLRGDAGALERLYRASVRPLMEYGCILTGDEAFVKDAIQEIFLRLLLRDEGQLHIQNISSYLFVALRNYIHKHLHQSDRRRRLQERYAGGQPGEDQLGDYGLPEDNLRLRYQIERELNQLPARQREILSLKFFEGFDYEEISEIMSISNQVARNYACRGMKRLREKMMPAGSVRWLWACSSS